MLAVRSCAASWITSPPVAPIPPDGVGVEENRHNAPVMSSRGGSGAAAAARRAANEQLHIRLVQSAASAGGKEDARAPTSGTGQRTPLMSQ
ncbi:hypothetical protein EYF80_043899 [Liparis tanakae]|uniref:Uncharacterized protein n=1 Tax=Liparis tanakae TaxID=230148 RepID=A0A4Z2FXE6_9TELE|nr:hypothetical protein EYF80_043899 [Liparis tanakae]